MSRLASSDRRTAGPSLTAAWRAHLGTLRHLPRLLRLTWEASPGLTTATVVLRLSRAVTPTAIFYVGKLILDAVVAQSRLMPPDPDLADWLATGRLRHLAGLLLCELALAILSDLLGRTGALVGDLLAQRYNDRASAMLMRHAAALDLAQIESSDQQDRLNRARAQVEGRSPILQLLLGQAQDGVTVLALAAGLAVYMPGLLALFALALVPSALGELYFTRQAQRVEIQRTARRRQIDYLRYLGSGVHGAKEVKLFGLGGFLVARFTALAEALFAEDRRFGGRRTLWGILFATLGAVAYYAGYAVIVWQTVAGRLTIGDLGFLAGSLLRLRAILEGFFLGLSQLASQIVRLDHLFCVLDLVPEVASPPDPVAFPSPVRVGIVFEGVGFRYPDSERWAVRGLDMMIGAGEIVALVGENGAGKTTIVKLLSRLYDPTEGRITVDGIDLRRFDVGTLRAGIAVILQDFLRYNFTARDNIAVGSVARAGDLARVTAAAERALADRVIARLPRHYDQPLGRAFAGGFDLSGGEWQKLAIARAYMRDSGILVLDEPTAALDARSEVEIFDRFRDLSRGRTCLLISHRFSTVRMADRIVVIEGGRVAESGTHAALVSAAGRYAELFELQSAGYR